MQEIIHDSRKGKGKKIMTEKQKISRETPGPIAQKFVRSVAKYAKTKARISNLQVFFVAQCIFEQYQLARRHSFLQNN